MNFFDELEDYSYNRPDKPIWALEDKSESNLVNWLKSEVSWLQEKNQPRFTRVEKYRSLYKGIIYSTQRNRDKDIDRDSSRSKVVVNNIQDLVESRVSKLVKFKPGIAVLPTSNAPLSGSAFLA